MGRLSCFGWSLAAVSLFSIGALPASSTDTRLYTYDAKGRLVESCQSTAAHRVLYSLDRTDNRNRYASQDEAITWNVNQRVYSNDQRFFLVMQTDGNFVLYGPTGALWASNTVGAGANLAAMQWDGNLVLYGPNGAVWSSNSYGNFCASLTIQNDGNVVISSANGAVIWQTGTGGH